MLALQALALRRMSFPTTPAKCHCCLVDFQMARLILKQQERIGPLGFQFSLSEEGSHFLLLLTRPAPPFGGIDRLAPCI